MNIIVRGGGGGGGGEGHTWYRLMKLAMSNPRVGMVPRTHDWAFKVGDDMQTACTVNFDGRTSVPE